MDNKNLKYSCIIPVYNEEKALRNTIKECQKVLQKINEAFEIIVVNDGSTDNSGEILKEIADIHLINNPYNLGYGASLKKGIKQARGEWAIIVDADGTYSIDRLEELLALTGNYDMVVANRRHDKDHLGRWPAKWILKKIAGFVIGKKIPDLNSGFRVFRRDLALEFISLYPSGFSFTTTITLAFYSRDYTIVYVDLPYYKRVGKSSIKPKHFFQFLNLIIKILVYFNPIRAFMPVTLILLLVGVSRLIRDIIVTGHIGNLSIIFLMASFLIFVLALTTESVVRLR